MARHQIFHIAVTQGTCDGEHAVDAIVEDQPAGVLYAPPLILVAALVVVRQPQRFALAAEDDTGVANICRIQDALTRRDAPELRVSCFRCRLR
jgi:hypothetical protein